MEKGALLSKRGASSDSNVIRTETTFGSNWLTFSWYVFMVPSLWYDARESTESGGTIYLDLHRMDTLVTIR